MDETEFDFEKIVSDSTKEIKELSMEAYQYFVSISKTKLTRKMTRSDAKDIARELLKHIGLVIEE